jgi:regulator of protease activity HflC (stomatin/prohibitin superfamily)
MQLDMAQIHRNYEISKGWREFKKYAFSIGTLGFGALYLWATTIIIKQGEIGLRRNNKGEMILLPPGRHSNFPWETYPVEPQSLSEKEIHLGPYTIISVETGYIAKTFNQGKLEILEEGQHLLQNASHVFSGFVAVKQETKKLKAITAYTSDNVGLTLHADVRYQIQDPETAIKEIDDIDNSIKEIAEISISQIVSHHNLADFAPATSVGQDHGHDPIGVRSVGQYHSRGITEVISELTTRITEQLRKLGITLLNIGITSWSINDEELAHELAQGAVIQSKMRSAEREADVKRILTKAEADARLVIAESEANAIKLKGAAISEITDSFGDRPVAQEIYARSQQIELVRGANNPNLFFSQQLVGGAQLPQLTVPVIQP